MRRALVATFEQDLRIQLPGATCAASRLNPFKIASHLSLGGSERKPLSFHLTTCSEEPGWPIWRPIWTIGATHPACSRRSKGASVVESYPSAEGYASGEDPRRYLMLQSSGIQGGWSNPSDLSVSIASARVRPRCRQNHSPV